MTGKRLFAHHGRDTSCYDPLFAFWYDLQGGKFVRHVLSFNHLPWYSGEKNINPPPNGAIAVGMKLNIADMDKDGRVSILEAFTWARLRVAESYERDGQLRTEHAVLEDNGDGRPSERPWRYEQDGADGRLAAGFVLAPEG